MMFESDRKLILVADDDEDDFMLIRDAFFECGLDVQLQWTRNGEETLQYLRDSVGSPELRPQMMFLDLNMPKIDGRQVLQEVRASQDLRHIPVIVLTNSSSSDDALAVYRLGVNSFVRKPAGFSELKDFIRTFYKYWYEHSKLF